MVATHHNTVIGDCDWLGFMVYLQHSGLYEAYTGGKTT